MNETQQPTFVIFGATGSVGSALARRIYATGGKLVLAGRDATKLELLASELQVESRIVDVCKPEAIEQCIKDSIDRFGSVSGIANCAGSLLLKPAHSTSYAQWYELLATNLTPCFSIARVAGQAMRAAGGSVVFVSSAAAGVGTPNHEAIAAAKAGVEGLVRSAAATYANRAIRFNAVAPGLVKSTMTKHLWSSEAAATQSSEMHPLGRLGEPDEVAAAIHWLLDPNNSWVTGQVIGIDGGLAQVLPRRTVRA